MAEAGAALVAAQLLAFYREPVRYRPRLTHGREPFGGGLLVFRFAQGRFPPALMRDLSAARREELREAALFFIRQVCLWGGASHYQVLCVASTARRETIKDHYHGLMALIHPDRQEAGMPHWPDEAAQRVNKAYEVLCDDARRREYDAGLHKAAVGSSTLEESLMAASEAETPGTFPAARGTWRARARKPVLYTALALSILFFAQVWWAAEVPREYSVLPREAPFSMSLQWMREGYSGRKPPPSKGEPMREKAKPEPATGLLAPLWGALAGGRPERAARRREVQSATAAAGPAPAPAVPVAPAPAPRIPERPPERKASPEPARASAPIAQASLETRAARELTAVELESLVARVVTYYEAGDVDKLLGLYDPASVGLWEAMNLRYDFEEFFRATRTRRLRLQGVSWDTSSTTARVKGTARLEAEYHDETERIARAVTLQIDVVTREGVPRIARLTLFPHER